MKNYWLLFASLVFFAWGGVSFTALLLVSILLNYCVGLLIQAGRANGRAYFWLVIGVAINLILLGYYKYTNFLVSNINGLFSSGSEPLIPETNILLPVGISFYTFHALSYLVDIYRAKSLAQRNVFNLSLYISMFSQLIAGPIIRYSDVSEQLEKRIHTLSKFSSGIERFVIGLGKKVLLANTFARVADEMFNASPEGIGVWNAWLGILCYTFQIYCDFAGYSDMAIGLGRMFGFEFMENFNYPYLARSVKEFWRRWHISLSTFFRDYLYIPLGGSRNGNGRMYINLIVVFFLTGFWHGASWSFVVWGLFHGFFMILEKLGLEKVLKRIWAPFAILYTFLVVVFAWVLFRADSLGYAVQYWQVMLDFQSTPENTARFMGQMNLELLMVSAVTILGSSGFFKVLGSSIIRLLQGRNRLEKGLSILYQSLSLTFYLTVLLLSAIYLIAGTYNPFIYYKF